MCYSVMFYTQIFVSNKEEAGHINGVTPWKSANPADAVAVDAFKNAGSKISTLLSYCFSVMLIQGHLPTTLISSLIAPLLKKRSNVSDNNNYRPVGLANISWADSAS